MTITDDYSNSTNYFLSYQVIYGVSTNASPE